MTFLPLIHSIVGALAFYLWIANWVVGGGPLPNLTGEPYPLEQFAAASLAISIIALLMGYVTALPDDRTITPGPAMVYVASTALYTALLIVAIACGGRLEGVDESMIVFYLATLAMSLLAAALTACVTHFERNSNIRAAFRTGQR